MEELCFGFFLLQSLTALPEHFEILRLEITAALLVPAVTNTNGTRLRWSTRPEHGHEIKRGQLQGRQLLVANKLPLNQTVLQEAQISEEANGFPF